MVEFYAFEPFGDRRLDYLNANVCSTLVELKRDPRKRATPFELREFMIFDPPHIDRGSHATQVRALMDTLVERTSG